MSDIYRIDYYKPAKEPGYRVFADKNDATHAELYLHGRQYARLEFELPAEAYKLVNVIALLEAAYERGKSARSAEISDLLRK